MVARRRPRNEPEPDPRHPTVELVPFHTHPPPTSTQTSRALAGFAVIIMFCVMYLGWAQYRSEQRQDAYERFVAESKELRDQQNRDVNERINVAVCAIMDRLPAGALLDPIREDYGCGPGLPLDALSPQQTAEVLRDYGPAGLVQTVPELYELLPADPLGAGIPPIELGDVPDND